MLPADWFYCTVCPFCPMHHHGERPSVLTLAPNGGLVFSFSVVVLLSMHLLIHDLMQSGFNKVIFEQEVVTFFYFKKLPLESF